MEKLSIRFAALLLTAVCVSLLVAPGTASAQETDDTTVEGRGWLAARGTGDVDITMGGEIRLRVEADVTIVDHAGDLQVRLRGGSDSDATERTLDVTLTDYDGQINVRGSDFTVTVDGQASLRARGKGAATLIGEGVYRTRNGNPTVWDGFVQIGKPEVQPG